MSIANGASNAIGEIYFVNSFIASDDSSLSIGNNVGALVEHKTVSVTRDR